MQSREIEVRSGGLWIVRGVSQHLQTVTMSNLRQAWEEYPITSVLFEPTRRDRIHAARQARLQRQEELSSIVDRAKSMVLQ